MQRLRWHLLNVLILPALAAGAGLRLAAQAPSVALPEITLSEALARAQANSSQFQAALTARALAHEDRSQARAAFFPTLNYNSQVLYTQGNGTPSGRYIANNAVHEYLDQAQVHQEVFTGGRRRATLGQTGAAEALTTAQLEIARRGLLATVVTDYYGLLAAQRREHNAVLAAADAGQFFDLSRKLENGGEVAHADVIKAQLQQQDRERAVQEAALMTERSRLVLAVLLFPNFNDQFTVRDDLDQVPPLPSLAAVQAALQRRNPELAAALAAVRQAEAGVSLARSAYLPTVSLDYFYGIDSTQFALHSNGIPNLGSAATATLSVPLWNWGITRSRVRQAGLRRHQAQIELSAVQRQMLADVQTAYAEARTAVAQLATLRDSAALATESLRLTNLRYQAGDATALEVVDAQNTLILSRDALVNGEARYRLALAGLQNLTGTYQPTP